MNKMDIWRLVFLPTVFFLSLAAGALFFSAYYSNEIREHEDKVKAEDAKFDQIASNIINQKLQFSDDKWIDLIRGARKVANTDYQTFFPLVGVVKFIAWYSIVLAVLNVLGIFYTYEKIKKRQNQVPE